MLTIGRGQSDRGLKREQNEDTFYSDDALGLYVVCDGMGGHNAGEVAARIASDAIVQTVRSAEHRLARVREGSRGADQLEQVLREAIDAACACVFETASRSIGHKGMGCTATALLVAGKYAAVGHVGDSRLYIVRGNTATRLTRDHTVAAEMVEAHGLDESDERLVSVAHILTRTVGTAREVEVDTARVELRPGDRVVLCTDGGWGGANGSHLLSELIAASDPNELPQRVVDRANEAGGHDNTTVVVVTMASSPPGDPAYTVTERSWVGVSLRRVMRDLWGPLWTRRPAS